MKKHASLLFVLFLLSSCGGGEASSNPNFSEMSSLPTTEEGFTVNYYEENSNVNYVSLNNGWVVFDQSGYVIEDYVGKDRDIVIPEYIDINGLRAPVIGIGRYAFYTRTTISTVTLPESVIFVGDYAFSASGINRLNVTPYLQYIGVNAFENSNVAFTIDEETNIEYLPTMNSPYGYAYRFGQGSISGEMRLREGCVGVHTGLFRYCEDPVILPSSLVAFGPYNFGDKYAKAVTDSSTLELDCNIPASFFEEACENLTFLRFGPHCRSIGSRAFYGCDNLSIVYIPENVTSIGYDAFANKSSATILCEPSEAPSDWNWRWQGPYPASRVAWGASSTLIEEDGNYIYFESGDDYTILRYKGSDDAATVPSTYKGRNVTRINDRAFARCENLTRIILPQSIIQLGKAAFMGATSLEEVTLPEGITTIPVSCFEGCNVLNSVANSSSITFIDDHAFEGCTRFDSSILLREGVRFGEYALAGTALFEAYLPSSLSEIPNGLFACCASLSSVTLPLNIVSIGEYAFYETGLNVLSLPEHQLDIGNYAFARTSLESIVLPSWLTAIPKGLFEGCERLSSIDIQGEVTSFGEECFENAGLTSFVFPASTSLIGERAFYHCKALTSVSFSLKEGATPVSEIPFVEEPLPQVITIGEQAFAFTSLEDFDFTHVAFVFEGGKTFEGVEGLPFTQLNGDDIGCYAFSYTPEEQDALAFSFKVKYGEVVLNRFIGSSLPMWQNQYGDYFQSPVHIPGMVGCKTIDTIQGPVFPNAVQYNDRSSPITIHIEEGVKKICTGAFSNCYDLYKVYLPKSLILIEEGAFPDFPDRSINFIGAEGIDSSNFDDSFFDKYRFTIGVDPDNATTITASGSTRGIMHVGKHIVDLDTNKVGDYINCNTSEFNHIESKALRGMKKTSIFWLNENDPSNVYFGEYAFKDSLLMSFRSGGSNDVTFRCGIFKGCTSMQRFIMDNESCAISKSMFEDCASLNEVKLATQTTSVGVDAFKNCTSLTEILLPDSVTKIEKGAFAGISGLTVYSSIESKPEGWDEEAFEADVNFVFGYVPETSVEE